MRTETKHGEVEVLELARLSGSRGIDEPLVHLLGAVGWLALAEARHDKHHSSLLVADILL